jgi:hypothetical protein
VNFRCQYSEVSESERAALKVHVQPFHQTQFHSYQTNPRASKPVVGTIFHPQLQVCRLRRNRQSPISPSRGKKERKREKVHGLQAVQLAIRPIHPKRRQIHFERENQTANPSHFSSRLLAYMTNRADRAEPRQIDKSRSHPASSQRLYTALAAPPHHLSSQHPINLNTQFKRKYLRDCVSSSLLFSVCPSVVPLP